MEQNKIMKPNKITVYVAAPFNQEDSIILNWREEGELLSEESAILGSAIASAFGLSEPPGKGVWVFDGEVSKAPEPRDRIPTLSWAGDWRLPTNTESAAWAAFKPKHVTYDK
jgi:hypothetical protein